jgi:DNA polymerase-3 subunit gamma/tau
MQQKYQVLARKYRPLHFGDLVGQEYTKQAIMGALDSGHLHHGFLFTGTRGVGKTTIARILAKSFNCETGISSTPCGICPTCLEIDAGHCIDVIEMDAASNTGVDDMRQLLENAQYAPSKNRFKIYIIDEVHMLSTSSFNALLKTLEEPPEHIKFIFATTDPQKLPVTILSRCLQFNLQHLSENELTQQMAKILTSEAIEFEHEALELIATFGDGSMRDSLSILDQAIVFSNNNGGTINSENVKKMLGVASRENVIEIIDALFNIDAQTINELLEKDHKNGINLTKLLEHITQAFYDIANYKATGIRTGVNATQLQQLSEKIDDKTLQILYQIAINSQKDMQFAPSEKVGVQMSLLRMMNILIEIAESGTSHSQEKGKKKV